MEIRALIYRGGTGSHCHRFSWLRKSRSESLNFLNIIIFNDDSQDCEVNTQSFNGTLLSEEDHNNLLVLSVGTIIFIYVRTITSLCPQVAKMLRIVTCSSLTNNSEINEGIIASIFTKYTYQLRYQ